MQFLCRRKMWKILVFVLAALISQTTPDNAYMEQWYSLMSDPKHECVPAFIPGTVDCPDGDRSCQQPLFSVAGDCSELDARWDYNFVSKIKPKRGGKFEGRGKIVAPIRVRRDLRPEHNNFKYGFKHNKCLKFFDDGVSSIQGNFVADRLEGHVRVEFHSGDFLVGHAHRSRLMGVVRFFNQAGQLQNVTILGPNSKEKVSVRKNGHGLFSLTNQQSRPQNRQLLTKDFVDVYNCEEEEEYIMRKCYLATEVKSVIKACDIDVRDETVEPTDPAKLFHWNLKTGQKMFLNHSTGYPDCSEEWSTDDVQGRVKEWISNMEQVHPDPFWYEYVSQGEPLDDANPTISIQVPEHQNKNIIRDTSPINITTVGGQFLAETHWNNGNMRATVSREDAKNKKWLQRVMVDYAMETKRAGSYYKVKQADEDDKIEFGTLGRLHHGRLEGTVRRFGRVVTDPDHLCENRVFSGVSFVGRYENGLPVGHVWRVVIGGGYIYGRVDNHGRLTGDEIAYIYPDLKTVYLGEFDNGVMVKARESEVKAFRCSKGIMELQFEEPKGPLFYYKQPTNETFGDQPLLTDPLDERYMYVRESDVEHDVADEGAFARVDIPKGTFITLYAGMNFDQAQIAQYNERNNKKFLEPRNLTRDDEDFWVPSKYHGSVPECSFTITIPHWLGALTSYRATLGHKLNHSFRPNCEYGGYLDTPRFGFVRAFYTNRDVKKDEELFISYGYPLVNSPPWYRELYNRTVAADGTDGMDAKILEKMVQAAEEEEQENRQQHQQQQQQQQQQQKKEEL